MQFAINRNYGRRPASPQRKARYLAESERVIGGMLDELIEARRNPSRWKTLPRREGVKLRARQVELLVREDELLRSADTLREWAREDSREMDRR